MMEGNKNKPRALLVFGAPCSGKSTFAEKFAKKYSLTYYNLDEIMEDYGLSRELVMVMLALVLKTKQTILIEGCIDTEKERIEMRNLLREKGYEPSLIWIQTDIATIRARLKSKFRSVGKAKDFYETAVATIEAPGDNEKTIILSGKHTFETQSRHVVAGLADLEKKK